MQSLQCLFQNGCDYYLISDSAGEVQFQHIQARTSRENRHHQPEISPLNERHETTYHIFMLARAHDCYLFSYLINTIVLELLQVNDFNSHVMPSVSTLEDISLPD